MAILATSYYVSYIPLELIHLESSPLDLIFPNFDKFLYATSMAIAEEYFFRGFLLDLLLAVTIPVGTFMFLGIRIDGKSIVNNVVVKMLIIAFVFMGYHWARYGTEPASLLYVLVGGFCFAVINFIPKRMSPSIIAHFVNNALAVFGV